MAIEHPTLAGDYLHSSFPHGNIADRPSSPTNTYNYFYFSDDENKLYFHNGSAWKEFAMDIDMSNHSSTALAFLKANSSPVSSIIMAITSTVPTGYLYCNGAVVSRTTYAALFANLGTLYGAGDGSTTFKLPDFRGRFLRGYDGSRSAAVGTPQGDGLPNIIAIFNPVTGTYNTYPSGAYAGYTDNGGANSSAATGTYSLNYARLNFDASLYNAIYGSSSYVTPYNHAVYMYIKY